MIPPPLTPSKFAELLHLAGCPRRDHARYASDCVVRHLLAHPHDAPMPPWRIDAGIGVLVCPERGRLDFTPSVITPAMPTLAERTGLFAAAVSRWVAAGLPVAPPDTLAARRACCAACPRFAPPAIANGWLGGCRSCGCTGAKLHLATESCPDGRWGRSS